MKAKKLIFDNINHLKGTVLYDLCVLIKNDERSIAQIAEQSGCSTRCIYDIPRYVHPSEKRMLKQGTSYHTLEKLFRMYNVKLTLQQIEPEL